MNRKLLCSLLAIAGFGLPGAAFAQAADPCAQNPATCATLINTHASAHLRIPNSAVDISLGLTATDKDLPTLQRNLVKKNAALLAFLRAQQVTRLVTTEVSFEPQTKSEKGGPDRTVGYSGTLKVSFRSTPEKAPDVLGGALANGANTIDSTQFLPTEEDVAVARRDLAAEATKTAVAQADAIAKAAGMHVASIRQIEVDNPAPISPRYQNYAPSYARMASMENAARAVPAVETAAGDQDVSMTVNIVVAAMR